MGNSQSTFNTGHTGHKVVATDYQLLGKNSSIRWGELYEMKNIKTNQMVFMQERHARDLETHQKTIEHCTYHISLSHNNLAAIYGFAGGEALDTFTNTYKVCVFFEHVVNSLNGIIRSRKVTLQASNSKPGQRFTQSFQYFDESELLRFMNQLVEVFDFLQRNGINQGDITPDVCFISKEGNIKVLDRKLIYNDISSFDQAEQGSTNVFLTPTELGALAEEKSKPSENRYKADVFRLGMTLLECATLQRSSDIYDWNNFVVNLDVLSSRLIEVKERYTSAFYDPLREMLRFEEEKRPDFTILNKHFQEEAAQNLALNMAIPYQEDESEMRKSIFGMGPKLITNFPLRQGPGFNPSTQGLGSMTSIPVQEGRRNSQVQQQVPNKEIFGRTNHRGAMPKAKREEDIDDTTELDSDMKVNKVPFTEARNSVGSRTPTESPAKRLQKMISERHVVQAEDKNESPDSGVQNAAVNTPNQRFSLSLRDFFKRGSPSKESAIRDASSPNQNVRGQKPPSPKMAFAENVSSSNRQHRRVASGSHQSNIILSKSSITPPQSRNQQEAANSPSQAFDLRKKPPYNGAHHTRSPTAQLPSKDYFSSYMVKPTASITPRQHDENVTASDYYYSVPSNPPTQRAPGQRPSYRVGNPSDSPVAHGDNGEVAIPNDLFENIDAVEEQRFSKVTPRTGRSGRPENKQSSAVSSRAENQEAKPDEQDLVEAILRKVLNSAGISPKKQPRPLQPDTQQLPYEYAKPQGLIRPVKVEMNENVNRDEGRGSVTSKYGGENLRRSYVSTGGSALAKSKLQEARDERKVIARPLEDQFSQAVEPKPLTSPKFGFRGTSVEPKPFMGINIGGESGRRSFYEDIRSTKGSVIIDKTKAFRGETVVNWEAGSPPMKKSIIQSQLEDPAGLKVEDRFEKAMERSQRSKGYMRDLADKMNKAGSRNASVEPTARSTYGGDGALFKSGLFSGNANGNEIRMKS